MKATGIVRKIDNLGRIVIPKELRKTRGLEAGKSLEIFVEGDDIILSKYERGCNFCGNMDIATELNGKAICQECIDKLN